MTRHEDANVCPATSLILGSLGTPDTRHNGCKKKESVLFRGETSKRMNRKQSLNIMPLELVKSGTPNLKRSQLHFTKFHRIYSGKNTNQMDHN